jgi:hypothetical protein
MNPETLLPETGTIRLADPALTGWRRMRAAALIVLCVPFTPCFGQAAPFQPFTIHYEVRHNTMLLARMERTLRRGDNGTFVYESKSTPAGILSAMFRDHIIERSVWELVEDRPRPLRYQYHHTGRKDERHVVLDFDWDKGSVTNTINEDPWNMKIPADTQDKLLYQYTMMLDMREGEKGLEYNVADGGELKVYQFDVVGREELRTPVGRLKTVKLQRIHGERKTVVWCAVDLGYLPVRLEQHRDRRMVAVTVSAIDGIR